MSIGQSTVAVADDSFETPPQITGAFQLGAIIGSPWTFSGSAGVASNQSAFTAGNPDAPDGTQVAVLKNNGSFIQSVQFSGEGTYNVSFEAAQRAISQSQPQQIEVLLDGSAVCTITPSGTSYVMYTTSNFTVAPGTHAITFLGLAPSTADSTAFIDTVSIGQPSVAVANPSFEAPPLPTGTFQFGAITGSSWTFSGSTGFAGNQSAFTAGNPNAPDGTQVAVLKNNGSMSQAVSFDAGSYVISFNAAQRAKYQSQAQQIEVLIDGTVLSTITPSGTSYALYTTTDFTVSARTHTLTFQGLSPSTADSTAFIDTVTISASTVGLASGSFESPSLAAGTWQFSPAGAAWQFSGMAALAATKTRLHRRQSQRPGRDAGGPDQGRRQHQPAGQL